MSLTVKIAGPPIFVDAQAGQSLYEVAAMVRNVMADQEKPKIEEITPSLVRILLTPERVEAIKEAINAMAVCETEYSLDYKRAIAILEEMLVGT